MAGQRVDKMRVVDDYAVSTPLPQRARGNDTPRQLVYGSLDVQSLLCREARSKRSLLRYSVWVGTEVHQDARRPRKVGAPASDIVRVHYRRV
jgi:hypothetical protein